MFIFIVITTLILIEISLIRLSDRCFFPSFFSCVSTFPHCFLKMYYFEFYPYSFTENNYYIYSTEWTDEKKLNFEFLVKKYLCFASFIHSYYPAKILSIKFLFNVFQTTYCNGFVIGKVLLSLLFNTDNFCFKHGYFFQIFICTFLCKGT